MKLRIPKKREVLIFLASAIVGAVGWTIFLTPYVLFVVGMTMEQYLSWLVMEFVLVPPVAPIVFYITKKALKVLRLA